MPSVITRLKICNGWLPALQKGQVRKERLVALCIRQSFDWIELKIVRVILSVPG